MSKARYDRVLDIIGNRTGRLGMFFAREFKGADPFNSIKVSDEDRIANYLSISSEMKNQLANDFGEYFSNYEKKMEDLIGRYGNAR